MLGPSRIPNISNVPDSRICIVDEETRLAHIPNWDPAQLTPPTLPVLAYRCVYVTVLQTDWASY